MRFTKMHGAGNDYIYVDCFHEPVPEELPQLARRVSDRHFGIGGDGLILIRPSQVADARMQIFNADGSEAEMCGNGIRCVAKYVYDHGICRKRSMAIETGHGVLQVELEVAGQRVRRVRVDMGVPVLEADKIPTTLVGSPVKDAPLEVAGRSLRVTCVSMGNPHAVVFVDEPTDEWVLGVGPRLECDSHFPERVNAEFVRVISRREVRMRVWERGSGETLACGTGAAAACVAGAITGRTGRRILAHLPGGDLELDWADDNHLYMSGPAVEVFWGQWPDQPLD
ncbi:MAG TPA: diaminopimelate epimerase [Planctomycetaceae bacterium]|nr:diaminopimelate epimerase [Planctomycetaceae bacterium]HIQ19963.1 diaminopimelate epimerase [Planctomycetota bacterium]